MQAISLTEGFFKEAAQELAGVASKRLPFNQALQLKCRKET